LGTPWWFQSFVTGILLFCDNVCDKNLYLKWNTRHVLALNHRFSCGIIVVFTQFKINHMEAEQLNAIANALSDLTQRHHALRGYL
jgi:hypothetical protein